MLRQLKRIQRSTEVGMRLSRAARAWHEAQASKSLVQARRSRFPKNLEREAEVHRKSAELIVTLSPDDV